MEAFVQGIGGYLATYTEDVNDETIISIQIVQRIATNYSVNLCLLLALLDYRICKGVHRVKTGSGLSK